MEFTNSRYFLQTPPPMSALLFFNRIYNHGFTCRFSCFICAPFSVNNIYLSSSCVTMHNIQFYLILAMKCRNAPLRLPPIPRVSHRVAIPLGFKGELARLRQLPKKQVGAGFSGNENFLGG